jgi:trk system potassium uptake protein TrkH
MGILVFVLIFIPESNEGSSMHLLRAESPGPQVGKIVSKMKATTRILYLIYLGLTVLEVVILMFDKPIAGYEHEQFFFSLLTAFGCAGTGGFGLKNDSLASYSSYIQIVVTVFMLLFSLNFSSYYLAFKGRFKDAFNLEIRTFVGIVAFAIIAITLNIRGSFATIGEAVKHVAFTVASIISTTGFMTVDFDLWPQFSKTILLMVMFIGACAGSTGGGIKVSRIIILFKGIGREIKTLLHPHRVRKITMDARPVDREIVRTANSYIMVYVVVFLVSLVIVSLDNYSFTTGFTAVATTINNVGPGLDMVGPTRNFAFFSVPSKLVLTFDMLAGRLELFPMLLLFTPSTWKNR